MENTKLINQVNDGFNYFNEFRLEELKTDDIYYINAFMKYIESLEDKLITLNNDYSSSNEEQKRLLTNYTKINKN
tara:strand:+ start:1117 stop:1341 length:225 start_codon:yes stop_codon:yes gene_type:complete